MSLRKKIFLRYNSMIIGTRYRCKRHESLNIVKKKCFYDDTRNQSILTNITKKKKGIKKLGN